MTYVGFDRTGGAILVEGSLGDVWRGLRGVGCVGIACRDGCYDRIIARRSISGPWELERRPRWAHRT